MWKIIIESIELLRGQGLLWLLIPLPWLLYQLQLFFTAKPLRRGQYRNLITDLKDPLSREETIADPILAPGGWGHFYHRALAGLLRRLDSWFGEGPLHPRAFHLCYLLAFIYPLLLVMVAWIFTGEGRIGTLTVFSPGFAWPTRLGWSAALAGSGALLGFVAFLAASDRLDARIAARLPGHGSPGRVENAVALTRMGALIGGMAVVLAVAWAADSAGVGVGVGVVVAGAGAGAVAGAVAVAFAFAVAVAVVVVAFAFAGLVAGLVAVGFASAVVGASAVAVAVAFAAAIAFAGAFAVAGAIAGAYRYATSRFGEGGVLLGLSVVYPFAMAALALWVMAAFVAPEQQQEAILFWTAFAFLPAVNAVFDLVSLQVSRGFMARIRAHRRGWNILWGLLDAVVAFLLLAGLYLTLFAALAGVDALFPAWDLFPVDRWRALFWGPARDWLAPEVLWLTLMAFTTLLITAAHLVLVFSGLFTRRLNRRDERDIRRLIRGLRDKARRDPEGKGQVPERPCRELAGAWCIAWERSVALGVSAVLALGYGVAWLVA
uniref:Uncharacterized protein n=1 Tax=Candidatus Kentrum sp. DK TaxID=2126562 RepID=A0A450S1E9_9GAMM|nr:MAG: hypothetical protein BECKDK2373C_GA0170839_101155 [Candidatus Kentron sp. DK]